MNKKQGTYTSGGSDRVTIKTFEQAYPDLSIRGIEVYGVPNKPRTWSINFFTKTADGKTLRSVKPPMTVENAVVTVGTIGQAMSRLIDDACLFISEQAQLDEDRWIARKQERETRGDFKEKPKQGLGRFSPKATPDEIAAARQKREANQAARRNADQEMRAKMKGRGK